MSKKPFDKFIKNELKGAKKKEAIRQQKRKLKEESRQRGEEIRKKEAEKYQAVGTRYGNTPEQRGGVPAKKTGHSRFKSEAAVTPVANTSVPIGTGELMPLNKFIAHAGISGRREAADLVKDGKVTVNGDIIYEPGFKVRGNEDIKVNGKRAFSQKNLVYILLNKPKDYLTTLKDPEGRKTVMDLIRPATRERVYPVGRLDRNTTGVLLLTNDGELAQKLTHPSFEIKKIYEVKLDKPVPKKDMDAIVSGLELEDGFIKADAVSYADAKDKTIVGIEIHSGRNRIVRRIFEHLGYEVRNLDRVMFANLTKKNVDRGKWRFLNENELRLLKFMNQSFVRAAKDRAEKLDRQVDELMAEEQEISAPKKKTTQRSNTSYPKTRSNDEARPRKFAPAKKSSEWSADDRKTKTVQKSNTAYKTRGADEARPRKYTPAKKSSEWSADERKTKTVQKSNTAYKTRGADEARPRKYTPAKSTTFKQKDEWSGDEPRKTKTVQKSNTAYKTRAADEARPRKYTPAKSTAFKPREEWSGDEPRKTKTVQKSNTAYKTRGTDDARPRKYTPAKKSGFTPADKKSSASRTPVKRSPRK